MSSEFIRKIRFFRYGQNLCKKYLRIDFNYKCAYCHTSEAEVISGHKYFEIDHFIPQVLSDDTYDVHQYDNLFYSCRLCNGPSGKSDTWNELLLNPCKEKIYGTHIALSTAEDFKLQVLTPRGEQFIETFKLNQKSQRKIRQKRVEHQRLITERTNALRNVISQIEAAENPDLLTEGLKEKLESMIISFEEETVGPYYSNIQESCSPDNINEQIFEAELQKVCNFEKVYHDFDIDYMFVEGINRVFCYHRIVDNLVFQNRRKSLRITMKQAKNWMDSIDSLLVVVFSVVNNTFYYVNFQEHIERNPIDPSSQYYSIWINENDILTKESILAGYSPRPLGASSG